MDAYINGIGSISAQHTSNPNIFLDEIVVQEKISLTSIEPDYKAFINPTLIRRMGRIIKMGVAAAQICLKDAGIEMPDAILTGTSLGCIEDTEKFLTAIIENKEQFLTPTSFIQSTHNTVGGQIALLLHCHNANFTYVHRGFSFESCVLDALMLLEENNSKNILIGGVDETTAKSLKLFERLGHLKNQAPATMELLNTKSKGSIAGEGAHFFVLSKNKNEHSYAQVLGCKLIYKPKNLAVIAAEIEALLLENKLKKEDIDLVIYGLNGDVKQDGIYYDLMNQNFNACGAAYFKHLSGEYACANSFGFMVAAQILKTKTLPQALLLKEPKKPIKHILLYNHYQGINHTLQLFRAC